MQTPGSTMERIVPDDLQDAFGSASLQLHYDRYRFAAKHLKPGRILDMACGMGYGAHLIATEFGDTVAELVAVDISADSIAYASKRYAHSKIKFMQQDAMSFSSEQKFDSIITLETIEHLPDPTAFVARLYSLLLPGGVLIASAPVTLSTDLNPYHLTDFTKESFRALFAAFDVTLTHSMQQIQPVRIKDLIGKKATPRADGMRKNILHYYLTHPNMLLARAWSVVTNGFANKYRVLVYQKNS